MSDIVIRAHLTLIYFSVFFLCQNGLDMVYLCIRKYGVFSEKRNKKSRENTEY